MKSSRSVVVPLVATAAAAAATVAAYTLMRIRFLRMRIAHLEVALEHAQQQRAAERTGRIRAQRELRKSLVNKDMGSQGDAAYPMTPIGIIRSCFTTRNGTPRQPLLVPLAKAHLVLAPGGVPHEALEGLALYSHCWVLYVFHENTDLPRLWNKPAHRDFRAKVRVPRLDGGKMGVFATRTPHRPCPIGLSVAKVEAVNGGTLVLSGVDLVDGTPVLDLKPYLPYCDSIPGAGTPAWVKAGGSDDVLAISTVKFTDQFKTELSSCWETMGKQSLYSSPNEFQLLLEQVLSRDIRSLNQRQRPHNAVLNHLIASAAANSDTDDTLSSFYHPSFTTEPSDVTTRRTVEDECGFFRAAEGNAMLSTSGLLPLTKSQGSDLLNKSSESSPSRSSEVLDGKQKHNDSAPTAGLEEVVYHLILEGINIAYSVNLGEVLVTGAALAPRR